MIDIATFGGIDFHCKTGLESCVRKHTGFKPFGLKQRLSGPKTASAFWKEPRRSRRGADIVKAMKAEPAKNPELQRWMNYTAQELNAVINKTGADQVVIHPWCHWIIREIADRCHTPVCELGDVIEDSRRAVFFTLVINNTWKRKLSVIDEEIRSTICPTYDLVAVFNTK